MLVLVIPTLLLDYAANQLIELSESFVGGLAPAGTVVAALIQPMAIAAAVLGIRLADKPRLAKVNVAAASVMLAAEAAAVILMNVFAVIILPLIILTCIYLSGAVCGLKQTPPLESPEQK